MPTKPLSELKAQVGQSVQTVEKLEIEAGKVEEFARAFRDDSSVFRDEEAAQEAGYDSIPAPLTFTRIAYFPRYRPDDIGANLGFDLGLRKENILHGEQEYEYERPPVFGDILSGTTTLVDVYQSEGSRGGTMTFCVYETEYRDQDDQLVLTERLTRIETGGDSKEEDE
ncbi:MaoC family dehydratase N-terminal domain-containing protein [Natronomonas gomsonensis]|uniref:FAS1-like dehydratase domain-containing protein n=1 Tax=Natronomonas gomsonensis TaxID=1046043 RepID=UPI0020CA87D1|nr:MaoC family dehydratase N-terminal domain-containing protein [Natronomonas gomsonensis]MCY4729947.1 MaoC family dehydratase N-terminal domain-containing protein [Natronomonas gomsonensis]